MNGNRRKSAPYVGAFTLFLVTIARAAGTLAERGMKPGILGVVRR